MGALARRQPERGRELRHDSPARTRARCASRSPARCGRRSTGCSSLVGRANRRAAVRGPHAFFEELRNGAHRFQGSADATMTHGEPYEFIQLGLHLERAATTVRVVRDALPGRGRARGGRPAARTRADRAAQVVQRLRGVRTAPRRVVRAARDRGGADPLARVPARGPLLPPHVGHDVGRPDRRARRGRPAAGARPALRRPRVRRGGRRLRCRGRRDARRARSSGFNRAGDAVAKAFFSTPRGARRRAREPGGAAAAMWLTVEHITRYAYDEPDQRGVHGASPEAAAPRRPALLLVRARDRAARGDRRRVPRPLRQHGPPFRPAGGPREPVRHGAERGVDDGRVRGRGAGRSRRSTDGTFSPGRATSISTTR